MSIDMYLEDSTTQANTTHSTVLDLVDSYGKLKTAIDGFALCEELHSQTYSSAKSYFTDVIKPLVQGGEMLSVAVGDAVERFPQEFTAQVCGHSVKESELLERIAQVGASITQEQKLLGELKDDELLKKGAAQVKLSALSGVKMGLEDLLQRLRDFNASSSSLFSDIDTLQTAIGRGLVVTRSAFNADSKTFVLPDDMAWADDIRGVVARYDERLFVWEMADDYGWDEAKARRWYPYKSQYGFEGYEISLIAEARDGLDAKYPNMSQKQRDYLFTRILGGITYTSEDASFSNELGFNIVADPLSSYFTKFDHSKQIKGESAVVQMTITEILEELGLTPQESQDLYRAITIQHKMTGEHRSAEVLKNEYTKDFDELKNDMDASFGRVLSDEEFSIIWNSYLSRFSGKNDFSHQMITTSVSLTSIPRTRNIEQLAGWKADATITIFATPTMGASDYYADLDAENILARMEQNKNLSYEQAQFEYYQGIQDGSINRAEEFLTHTDLDTVKEAVLDGNISSDRGRKSFPVKSIGPDVWVWDESGEKKSLSEEEKEQYIAENYPAAYNFLKNIENRNNVWVEYAVPGAV